MKCPSCQAELAGEPKFCPECGHNLRWIAPLATQEAPRDTSGGAAGAFKLPTGFSRTLATELVTKQLELHTLVKLGELVQFRTYQPGEVLIRRSDKSRDLFFLTHGRVEISREEGEADLVLNEIAPPYVLGEIAFLFGTPRTATATAKTLVKTFVLRHDELKELLKDHPVWLPPLLTSLSSDMKSLHDRVKMAEKRVLELEKQVRPRS
jgi:CRP-like cAMP-binding protein